MPPLELRLTPAEFHQLPRNAAYKYDYHAGSAWLNPRPRYYHALLDLSQVDIEDDAEVPLRLLQPADWDALVEVFAEAFSRHQPFAGTQPSLRLQAARKSLEQTQRGGDGPFIGSASFVAIAPTGLLLGGVLLTLLPPGDPLDWDGYIWMEPPPSDCIEQRLGRPHLTWIFVRPESVGRGVGMALLRAAVDALLDLGYDELLSTFLLGNESSMLWHWRAGFRLLSYPGSFRRYANRD